MRINLLLMAAALLLALAARSQSSLNNTANHHCGTSEYTQKKLDADPALKARFEEQQRRAALQDSIAFLQGYPSQRNGNDPHPQSPPTYIIPIVFHVIHDYGAENISDAQILDALRVLNEDFRKLNADTSATVPAFQGIAGDAQIEFRLASLDPYGNCTNGIDRIPSILTYVGNDTTKLNSWDHSRYLNVWVCASMFSPSVSAYATFPGLTSDSTDGVIIRSDYVGSMGTSSFSRSHTLTHEIGHFLGLRHPWATNVNDPIGVQCGDEGIADTPVTKGWNTCTLTNTDVCNMGIEENVQNFMEYSFCETMFTTGQCFRMASVLNDTLGRRDSLWTQYTHLVTGIFNPQPCAPIADFAPTFPVRICEGGTVVFSDFSSGGQTTSWLWTFTGGTPSISTDSMPVIQYFTQGIYNVTLEVANPSGSDTLIRPIIVEVLPASAMYSDTIYQDGVEDTVQFPADWYLYNPHGYGMNETNLAASEGQRCMFAEALPITGPFVTYAISPSIELSAIANPVLTFDVAFANIGATNERLRVYVSTDCGQTWVLRWSKLSSQLVTAPSATSPFYPDSSEWRTETVTFTTTQLASSSVLIKFEFTFYDGDNVFIDNINIFSTTGITSPDEQFNSFSVYPNPAEDNTLIEFGINNRDNVNVEIVDMTGRVVKSVFKGELADGVHQFPVQTAELSSGIYLVRLITAEGRFMTQRLVVE